FSIARQVVDMNVVSLFKKIDDFGYIKLENFSDKSYFEFQAAYFELKKQKIQGLIIDLRNNPGGLLDQAVKIVNLFIPKNKVVVTSRGKSDNSNMTFMTKQNPDDLKIPIIVLVNSNSASASEIVAGTLQDYDRAVVIGENTYGKGLVQRIFNLGYNSKIKITISKYFIPSGRCIQAIDYSHNNNDIVNKSVEFFTTKGRVVYEGNGIRPDIIIENDTLNNVVKTFVNKYVIFRFINEYYDKSDTSLWKKPLDVKFDDSNKFWDFVVENEYLNYLSEFKHLESLESNTTDSSSTFKQLQVLKNMYIADIKNIIDADKDGLNMIISKEIVERKFYRQGVILFDLKFDAEIQKGKQILSNKTSYKNILGR
ncbi:MAG: S41 family peptidase, partial [Bacteroidota bacterium]|nr:S41 family peptidase [Bacteroidota bacterium]